MSFTDSAQVAFGIGLPSLILGGILGPALRNFRGYEGSDLSLVETREEADVQVPWTIGHLASVIRNLFDGGRGNKSGEGGEGLLIGIAFGFFVGVTLFLRYRVAAILGLLIIAIAVCLVTIIVLLVASRKGIVSDGGFTTASLVVPFVYSCAGFFDVAFLWDPPAAGPRFAAFLEDYANTQLLTPWALGFVGYQVLGALLFAFSALGVMSYCLAAVSSIYITLSVTGQWLWKSIYWITRPAFSVPLVILVAVLVGLSIYLTGGWLFETITNRTSIPTIPSSTP